ncbi:hypothetical protein [Arthrobacter sp. SPG23]|uniref:hypothetical protein n=1 Tax=Arthrobacter sp. SPG23 TaxID=1610703 RepID=UPI001185A3FD|nr:hypothetical protein [Arthrobacter sp. SPG23]
MDNEDLEPSDGGATSIERRASEPLCSFDPEAGFSLNPSTVDELRWYTYLSRDEGDEETLLQSRNDD